MKFWPILPLTLLAMQSALCGQDADLLMQKGNNALAARLWEVAADHFKHTLAIDSLGTDEKSEAAIRLAEAWIHDSKSAEALELLDQSFAQGHPETPFWKAQALAGMGRFTDAVDAFSPVLENPDAPWHSEAGFTMANLQLSLGQPDEALNTLSKLTAKDGSPVATKARLRQVAILLDLKRADNARQIMPDLAKVSDADQPLATLLEARLLLAEGNPADAASGFQQLITQPQGLSLRHYNAAAIGLADALYTGESPEAASSFLLTFVQNHPDSPSLEAMFQRLLDWLPEKPSPAHPVLARLKEWSGTPHLPITGPLDSIDEGAAAAWPVITESSDLVAFSLFTRAIGLRRAGTPDTLAEARQLLTRLRLEQPNHFLATRALFRTARWALEDGSPDRAVALLDILRETANSPLMKGQAAFLAALTTYDQGNLEQAATLFEAASQELAEQDAAIAQFNAAIAALRDGETGTTVPVIQPDLPQSEALSADLELERALSAKTPETKREAIEDFLTHHPDHARVPEARLAAAEAALDTPTPDLSFARAQLDTLAANPEQSATLSPARLAWIKLRIEDLSDDPVAAIATAESILENHPAEPEANDAAFILGRNLFETQNYNAARLILEKHAATDPNPARAQASLLLAARSAALVPTNQSQQEALSLFDKTIAMDGPVTPLAKLEKARLMIDMNRIGDAADFLRKWYASLKPEDPLHLPAGLLLGEAIYAQGSINPASLTEALAVYDELLVHAENRPQVFNRLQYLRGRTLEQIPDPNAPSNKREKEAFAAYYSVLEATSPPAEWHYFELCGFRALALLEKAERWPAAVACAKKIASFNGPRAEEAAARANQIQLKHMIWED